jgi:hypothetical protein
VADRKQSRDAIDGRSEVVAVALGARSRMQRHAHAQSLDRGEVFACQRALGVARRGESVEHGCESRAKGVAHRFKDVRAAGFHRRAHQRIVARQCNFHRLAVALPARGAAFDIRKQKRDRAGRTRRSRRVRVELGRHKFRVSCLAAFPLGHAAAPCLFTFKGGVDSTTYKGVSVTP